jgi:hypothetical protein
VGSSPTMLFYNGQLLILGTDYSVSGTTWTYITFAPSSSSYHSVLYFY